MNLQGNLKLKTHLIINYSDENIFYILFYLFHFYK